MLTETVCSWSVGFLKVNVWDPNPNVFDAALAVRIVCFVMRIENTEYGRVCK